MPRGAYSAADTAGCAPSLWWSMAVWNEMTVKWLDESTGEKTLEAKVAPLPDGHVGFYCFSRGTAVHLQLSRRDAEEFANQLLDMLEQPQPEMK